MKLKTVNLFLFLTIVFLFSQFLKLDLQSVASLSSEENVDLTFLAIIVFSIFILCILFIYLNKDLKIRPETSFLRNLMFCIFGISIFHSFNEPFSTKLLNVTIILPYLIFLFTYISTNVINRKVLLGIIPVFFLYIVFSYFQEFAKIVASSLSDEGSQTNASYFVLYLLPLMLCLNKKWIHYLAFLITIFVTLSSAKRSGTIAVLLGLIVFVSIELYTQRSYIFKKRGFVYVLFVLLIFIIAVVNTGFIQDLSVFNRMLELKEDGGSGRTEIYLHTLSMIGNSDILSLLLGHGWDGVLRDSKLEASAHNDFLEIIYDFGIIGIFMYLLFYYFLFKKISLLVKKKSQYAVPFAVSAIFFAFNSFGSHIIIYPGYMCIFSTCWGYILGQEFKQRHKIST